MRSVRDSISFTSYALALNCRARSALVGTRYALKQICSMQKESEVKAHETSYFGSADFFDVSSRGNIRLRGARALLRRSSLASLEIMFLIIDALKRAALLS